MMKQRLIALTLAANALLLPFSAQADSNTKPAASNPGLSAEFVYKFLIAEISGQRGDVNLAGSLMYELAKSAKDPRLAERSTKALLYGKQGQAALQAATLWADLDGESADARQILTQLLLASGKTSELRPHLQKLLADEKNRAAGFLYLSGLLSRSEDKAGIFKLIQDLAKPYANLPEARIATAHAAWAAGKEQVALAELKAADKLRPGWEIAALLQGQILQARPLEALQFYRVFLDQYPASNEVRLANAKLLVNEKQFETARKEFDKLIETNPNNADIHVTVGLLSVQLEDLSNAQNHFKQALELQYKEPEQVYFYLAQLADQAQQHDEAQKWFDAISPDNRFYFDGQIKAAIMQAKLGKLDIARKRLQSISNMTPEQEVMALQTEASMLSNAGKQQEAFDLLAHAVSNLPNSSELIYDYAMVAERVKRFDIMEQELRKLMLMKPDFAQAYNALGYTLADRNERLEEAQELIEKALSITPDDHYILDSMGWVHYRQGRLDEALEYLQRAYQLQPDPEIAAHLGEVLWQQGKREDAISTWEKALQDFPENEALLNTSKKFKQ